MTEKPSAKSVTKAGLNVKICILDNNYINTLEMDLYKQYIDSKEQTIFEIIVIINKILKELNE